MGYIGTRPQLFFQKIIESLDHNSKVILEKLNLKTDWVRKSFNDSPEDISLEKILEKYLFESLTLSRFNELFSIVSIFSTHQLELILNAIKQLPDIDSKRECSIQFLQRIASDLDFYHFGRMIYDKEIRLLVLPNSHLQKLQEIRKELTGRNSFNWVRFFKRFPNLLTERDPNNVSQYLAGFE